MNTMFKLLIGSAAIVGFAVPAAAQTSYPYPYPQQAYPQQPAYPYAQPGYAYPQQGYAYPQQQQGYAYPQQGYAYPQQQQQGYAYPQQGYAQPGYPQQGYQQGGLAGLIGQLLGNRYAVNDRTAVTQCAAAAQNQASAQYRGNRYGQPNRGYNGYGYANASSARVTGITSVQRRNNGLRVSGTMSSGAHNQGYAYGNQGYHPGYARAASDLSFRCNVNSRGAVTNVQIRRNSAAYRR